MSTGEAAVAAARMVKQICPWLQLDENFPRQLQFRRTLCKMKVAHFLIDDRLHWLLTHERRRDNFDYPFNGPQTVKHLIESLGIPHTEVGELKADSGTIGLDHLVGDGEKIEVRAATPMPEPVAEPRFVLDCHLGRLASDLRMLGLDTRYRNDFADGELVQITVEEGRILLTRDRRLLMHRNITQGHLVQSLEPDEQFREVIGQYGLKKWIKPFQRCIRCNHPLENVSKEEILERLQPLTRMYFDEFRICPGCQQLYWKGSHYERMQKIIEEIRKGP